MMDPNDDRDRFIEIQHSPTVNYAMQQNDIPVIHSLRVNNLTSEPLQDLILRIHCEPAFAVPKEIQIASIGAGEAFQLGAVDLQLSHDYLSNLTESVVGTLHVQLCHKDEEITAVQKRIEVLAYDEWSGLSGLPEILAAFVLPNHPAIEGILADAAQILSEKTGNSSLSGYQSKDRNRVLLVAAAIYVAIQRRGIHYINPPASFEETGQKIRLPDRILDNRLGTCIDCVILMAACLEQTGLHPLVVITAGHAFCGVWLDDDCFADCATDDLLRLRKRVDLGEICVFETTYLTVDSLVPFDQAVQEGLHHLADPESFRCVIDIFRSRKSRIRPLPIRAARSGDHTISSVEPTAVDLETPLIQERLPSAVSIEQPAPSDETPASRLDRWKRKLLDLTLRNRLLNFKDTKKTLPLLCPDLASLEDALAEGESFSLHSRLFEPDDESQLRDADVHRRRTGEDLQKEQLLEESKSHRLHADVTELELSRRLLEIYREARTSLEENGANTLYLALGFLAWYEADSQKDPRLAPIILIPLEIDRHSIREGFAIKRGDDDAMVNITLLELLKKDYQLSIPGMDPIPQDDHGIDVNGILQIFRRAIRDIDRWEVLEHAFIGHFSFTKFLMWRDLEVRSADLQQNKVASHLINTPQQPYAFEGRFPDADQLDDTYQPKETFCPMNADSSQLAAVYAAAEGQSFVLHGPPGTGKSQTITNLIAHALACGKSVLFVSEKMAALNVVQHRLEQCGLGAFALELHSNKSNKKGVIDQLSRALVSIGAHSTSHWAAEAERLASLRNELNEYVRSLHKIRETGESLYHGVSRLVGLRDVPRINLGWSSTMLVNRIDLDHLKEVVEQMKLAAGACPHPGVSVWASAGCDDWSPLWRNDIERAIHQLEACRTELQSAAESISEILGMGKGNWSACDLASLSQIGKVLLGAPCTPTVMVTTPDWDSLNTSVTDWIIHGQQRDTLRKQLYQRYSESILQLDPDSLCKQFDQAANSWFLPRLFGFRKIRKTLSKVTQVGQKIDPDAIKNDLDTACKLRDEEQILEKAGDRARELLGQFWHGGEADWLEVARVRDWTASLRKLAAQIAGTDFDCARKLRECWARLASEGNEQLAENGPIGQRLLHYEQKWTLFNSARSALEALLALDLTMAWNDAAVLGYLASMSLRLQDWLNHLDDLRAWCYWRKVRAEAIALDLRPLVDAYEHQSFNASEMTQIFARAFYQWWVEKTIHSEPVLRGFFSRDFERKIEQFREVDQRYTDLVRSEIQARITARMPHGSQPVNQNSEMGILQRQIQKQRAHMPIRQLFQRIPNLLPRLKPCLLMSPMSVAQYLDPAHPAFDLVVFDEASQIPVWDAVGAIARGKEAIIVGDPKQLPPTNFFAKADDEEINEDIVEDLESILDDCLAAQLPQMHLR